MLYTQVQQEPTEDGTAPLPPVVTRDSSRHSTSELEDESVAAEREALDGGAGGKLVLKHLRKIYGGAGGKVAVRDLCLRIQVG